jgi:hypothetical protein
MFARIVSPALLTMLALALLWALVLGWWQANDHEPGTGELLLHLVLLPAALIGGFWLLRGFIDHLRRPPVEAGASADRVEAADSATTSTTAQAERRLSLVLLDGQLSCAAGSTAAALVDAVRSARRPGLDDTLVDADGFPVHAARVADLDVEAVRDALAALDDGSGHDAPGDDTLRALALVAQTLPRAWPIVLDAIEQVGKEVAVRLIWLQPPTWSDSMRPLLLRWLDASLCQGLPAGCLHIATRAVANDAEALGVIDEAILALNRSPGDTLCVVLGAVSHVDETTVQAWQSAGRLLRADTPDGRIPGEAAAVLVLAGEAMARRCGDGPAVAIGRVGFARRDTSADAGRRAAGTTLGELIDRTLGAAAIAPDAVAVVTADADHRASRQGELMSPLGERFEALDPLQDCPAIGTVCGALEPIGALLALLCAADACRSAGRPALCLSTQHPWRRAAVMTLAIPHIPEPPAGAT